MRSWWKYGLLASCVCVGMLTPGAGAQFPPPQAGMPIPIGGGGMGMSPMPAVGGMGLPPGLMGPPPGADLAPGCDVPAPVYMAPPSAPPAPAVVMTGPGQRKRWPLCWEFSVGYSLIWYTPAQFPISTSGSTADTAPGALGQPGTSILPSATSDAGAASALRATLTYWISTPEFLSLDMNYFFMENRVKRQSFQSDADGNPLLARPFFNPATGLEDADVRSTPTPGLLSGSISDSIVTRMMGAEAGLRWYPVTNVFEGSAFNFLVGARWLQLNEEYSNLDTTAPIGGVGNSIVFSDYFAAYNDFIGGQTGVEWQYKVQGLTLGLFGKVAAGPNVQRITVNGRTVTTDLTTGAVTTDSRGFYAQPSNSGTFSSTQFAVLSEAGAKLQIDWTDSLRINVGYSYFLLDHVARPVDQIDRNINIQQPNGVSLPAPPGFRQSSFGAQMLNVSLEFRF